MSDIKSALLSKLDYLPDRISYKDSDNEIVTLNAIHINGDDRYQLSIECEVIKMISNNQVEIKSYNIINIHCFKNVGEDGFDFTKKELYQFIQY